MGTSEFGVRLLDTTGNQINLEDLAQDKLKKLLTAVSETRKKKYQRRRNTKYGNLNKGFTEEELTKFFKFCSNSKAYACFFLMAHLGLRIGEVVKLKLSDVDFNKKTIRIETEKAHTIDFLYLHNQVRILLKSWFKYNLEKIEENGGYLFFSDTNYRQYISPNWLGREFRDVCKIAKLDETYGVAEDINNPTRIGRPERKLYRLTTHSLRHYFITKVYANCKDPLKTQKLARHTEFKSTQTYIHLNQSELDTTMQKVFGNEVNSQSKDEVKELMTFFKMWKEMKSGK